MHPDVQRKAQEQLDEVLGNERMPTFEDLDNLPYIHAIVKEVGRWHSVLPLGELLLASILVSVLNHLY